MGVGPNKKTPPYAEPTATCRDFLDRKINPTPFNHMPGEWHDNLTTLATDDLAEYAEELRPLVEGERDLDDETQDKYKGLDQDLSFLRTPRVRSYIDLLQVEAVKDHITRLPEDGETIHGVISGRYPLFAIVPAILELSAPATIAQIELITLSYSKDNAADLIELLDAGKIGAVRLMVSHYFAHANPHLYDPLAAALHERGHKVLALRTHAKIILAKLSTGATYVVESSANLRSCKNIEQFAFTRDQGLYDFHRKWVNELFAAAEQVEKKAKGAGRGT